MDFPKEKLSKSFQLWTNCFFSLFNKVASRNITTWFKTAIGDLMTTIEARLIVNLKNNKSAQIACKNWLNH